MSTKYRCYLIATCIFSFLSFFQNNAIGYLGQRESRLCTIYISFHEKGHILLSENMKQFNLTSINNDQKRFRLCLTEAIKILIKHKNNNKNVSSYQRLNISVDVNNSRTESTSYRSILAQTLSVYKTDLKNIGSYSLSGPSLQIDAKDGIHAIWQNVEFIFKSNQ